MRRNPINPVADARGAFEVQLGFFRIDPQKTGNVQHSYGRAAVARVVETQFVVFVIGDDECVFVECNRSRGVAHAEVMDDGRELRGTTDGRRQQQYDELNKQTHTARATYADGFVSQFAGGGDASRKVREGPEGLKLCGAAVKR